MSRLDCAHAFRRIPRKCRFRTGFARIRRSLGGTRFASPRKLNACRTLAAGSPRSQAYAGASGGDRAQFGHAGELEAFGHAGELEAADALVRRHPLARTPGSIAQCRASARARVLVCFEAETSATLRLRTVSGCRPAGC